MADDKNKLGFQDRNRVAGDHEYEVGYFASKFGLLTTQVRELIAKHGNDRDTLEREAKAMGTRYRSPRGLRQGPPVAHSRKGDQVSLSVGQNFRLRHPHMT